MAEQHRHFVCPQCEALFCNEHPEFQAMKEGDPCPTCHIATVKEAPSAEEGIREFMAPFLEELQHVIGPQNDVMLQANEYRRRCAEALERIANLLSIAVKGAPSGPHRG